jgi:hypothetical protein
MLCIAKGVCGQGRDGNMSDQGVVVVRIGDRSLPLLPESPVAVAPADTPAEAIAMIRCDTCGATGTLAAPVTDTFYDDDHFGRFELWYDSRHVGACSACGTAIDVHLGYTLTRYPLTGAVELSLNQLTQAAKRVVGGVLVPASGADILAARRHRQAAR